MDDVRPEEIWQVDANGQTFITDFAEMTVWIAEGALLRHDKVRKGNLRFIEAGKVPLLAPYFNAKDDGTPLPPPSVSTAAKTEITEAPADDHEPIALGAVPEAGAAKTCSIHSGVAATFACSACVSLFCTSCPSSYGSSAKSCPYCGAICDAISGPSRTAYRPVALPWAGVGTFGFGDLAAAFAYPFKFKASLVLGAIMFTFFSLGQSVVGFGGVFMLGGAIFCAMLANTLTFGILANTVENMAAGRLGLNFMPTFEDFSVWDDVFQPFFLMIAVYVSSFGPLAALFIVSFFAFAGPVKNIQKMNTAQTEAARLVAPDLPYAASAAEQSQRVQEILRRNSDAQRARVEAINNGAVPPGSEQIVTPGLDDFDTQQMNRVIQAQQKAQLEAAVGQTPETVSQQRSALMKQMIGYGAIFLIFGGFCLLWAFVYYPAACAVAGYTQSFGAVINPVVGLDTIRRLGFDYLKLLLMCLGLALAFGVISLFLSAVLSPFNMPGVGNLPAQVVGSLFAFYLSIVFAVVLGSILYKAADRLELPGA